ncbi:DOMON domain-containing protein [Gaetbulibacter sp. M235]|uniref:DOMON domain-containing protein n=1 Tax=Gaetbulibacter sp. M235 TaxID=3126510 RepID=UPI00374EAC7D
MNRFLFPYIFLVSITYAQQKNIQVVATNGMTVRWYFENERIFFEMIALTDGWLAIGLNKDKTIENMYLLMGNVINNKPNVVEYYNNTTSPDNFNSIEDLGTTSQVKNITGTENCNKTCIRFSLPIEPKNKYQKGLLQGSQYTMVLAYGTKDDFEDSSTKCSLISVKL